MAALFRPACAQSALQCRAMSSGQQRREWRAVQLRPLRMKGTERTGNEHNYASCGTPLYKATDAGYVYEAINRTVDADGRRCAACGGHLRHIFEGEGFPDSESLMPGNKFFPSNAYWFKNRPHQDAVRIVLQHVLEEAELSMFTEDDLSRMARAGFVTLHALKVAAENPSFLERTLPGRYALQAFIVRAFTAATSRGGDPGLSSYTHRRVFGVGHAVTPANHYFVQPDVDKIVADLEVGRYCVLLGPRQSGKSTVAWTIMRQLKSAGAVWPVYLGGLADANINWTTSDLWSTLIRYLKLACPQHFQDAAGSDAVAFMSLFSNARLTAPVCLVLDEADSLLNLPSECLDAFFSTVRELKQSFNLRSFLLIGVETVKDLIAAGYRRSLLEGSLQKAAATGQGPRRLSPFPHDYSLRATGFKLHDIVDLLEQVNMDYNGAVQDVEQIAASILELTCGHKGLVGMCLAFVLRLELFSYVKWLERVDSYELGTYVFGQATYSRIVDSFKIRARTPDGYKLLLGFLEEVERRCDLLKFRDLLAEGVLAVKRVDDAAGDYYVGISSPLLLTEMLRECEVKSDNVQAPPSQSMLDRKWLIVQVVQTMDMKALQRLESENVDGPSEYVYQFAFMCRLKAVLRQAYPQRHLVVLPEVREKLGVKRRRSQRHLNMLVTNGGAKFGFEFQVNGDKKSLADHHERAKTYNKQHSAQVFLMNFSIDKQAKELTPDNGGVMFAGITFDTKSETVTVRFIDSRGCKQVFHAAVRNWDGIISFD
ncbi:hypothetical protein SELMODRAFT_447043 [Selaginella moellendorffii]|uniref:Uncharacterized protein n=1 Tax=Selaginella moellendorffii TaxID=88036 RepID=D8SW96_SELML|nr:uncharacterized protein LOC9630263 [Selaginella moellendorffii]EFJ11257.1 hypothetical protein SELMODRAFT_447043 [Selaginella moellendorffii]|eukprot:XP_002987682.1 uncharacterized protein LOC9630263 [Selaginella moellendorffii]